MWVFFGIFLLWCFLFIWIWRVLSACCGKMFYFSMFSRLLKQIQGSMRTSWHRHTMIRTEQMKLIHSQRIRRMRFKRRGSMLSYMLQMFNQMPVGRLRTPAPKKRPTPPVGVGTSCVSRKLWPIAWRKRHRHHLPETLQQAPAEPKVLAFPDSNFKLQGLVPQDIAFWNPGDRDSDRESLGSKWNHLEKNHWISHQHHIHPEIFFGN